MSGRPVRRRTTRFRWSAAAAFAVLALAATACGGEAATAPTPDSTYGGAVAAAEAPAPKGYRPAEIQGVKINVPDDWEAEEKDGRLCMRPPGEKGCGFGSVEVRPHAAKNDPAKWPRKGKAHEDKDGWAAAPDTCRSPGTMEKGDVGVAKAKLDTGGFTTHADGLKSHHAAWTVTCENDDVFEVRLWYLPQSDVAVYVQSVDSRFTKVYDAIAKSMDITAYKK
ncbi:hypothetical protein CLV63_108189 [Murinocardiopsis flavida]|uniref:Uncharacterized protein n=1 Tax=Murinocardiopsis flavida TaxID=645275 RepID=A0A2P8DJU6_9ACTN|nr:hypothetical protein [Murinocardiopsis flavida]PSK97469.1 hypothetical protein CLV63_108189 [Murinocardiopsis flavida]